MCYVYRYMDTVAGDPVEYRGLEEAYKEALRKWSDLRAIYPVDSPEVIEMFRRIEELEARLRTLKPSAVVKYRPPAGGKS